MCSRPFTKAEDRFIKANYLRIPAKRISAMLGRSESGARQRMAALGLIVPKEVAENFKKQSHFRKGAAPFNKGKRLTEYLSKKSISAIRKTQFKKGSRPRNTKYNGAVSVRNDSRGKPYKFIRIRKNVWQPLQRYLWEQKKGKLKRGEKVIFRNGDTMDYRLSNLKKVSCSELMKRNSLHRFPKEISTLIQLQGVLTRKINNRIKHLRDEK